MQTSSSREAFKMFRLRKDGSLGPLFINAKLRVPVGEWLDAEDVPTKGFAHRPGWHCTVKQHAPHLKLNPKVGCRRVWARVQVTGVTLYDRPESQGGTWILAKKLKVIEVLA